MAIDITNPRHISRLIDDTKAAIDVLFELRDRLEQYDIGTSINQVHDVLTAPGAIFPPGFNTTPAIVNDARFALATTRSALETSLGSTLTALNTFRYNVGVLVGTG